MTFQKINDIAVLENIAVKIRINIIKSLAEAGSGHTGGSLGLADIFTALYFNIMEHKPYDPHWEGRDRLILSIGHVAPVLYATLAVSGYFPEEELKTLRKLGSRLQGHPGRDHGLPGIELSAGSLGQGLSVAVGMTLAARMDDSKYRVFCILGDGELQEGSVWEAAMSAAHYKLSRLIAVVDRNKLQIDGPTEKVMRLEPLADKWRSFGWNVLDADGNNIGEFIHAVKSTEVISDRPSVIIANTLMGKGITGIENNHKWHGKVPSQNEAEMFIKELEDRKKL